MRSPSGTIASACLALAVAGIVTGCGDGEGGVAASESSAPPPTATPTDSSNGVCRAANSSSAEPDSADVTVGTVTRDPRGPRTEANLNREIVTLTSSSEGAIDLTGWTVEDKQGVTFRFPPGNSICRYVVLSIHSGQGIDTDKDVFADWGWRWDEDGDTVRVRDAEHVLVAECSFGATSQALRC